MPSLRQLLNAFKIRREFHSMKTIEDKRDYLRREMANPWLTGFLWRMTRDKAMSDAAFQGLAFLAKYHKNHRLIDQLLAQRARVSARDLSWLVANDHRAEVRQYYTSLLERALQHVDHERIAGNPLRRNDRLACGCDGWCSGPSIHMLKRWLADGYSEEVGVLIARAVVLGSADPQLFDSSYSAYLWEILAEVSPRTLMRTWYELGHEKVWPQAHRIIGKIATAEDIPFLLEIARDDGSAWHLLEKVGFIGDLHAIGNFIQGVTQGPLERAWCCFDAVVDHFPGWQSAITPDLAATLRSAAIGDSEGWITSAALLNRLGANWRADATVVARAAQLRDRVIAVLAQNHEGYENLEKLTGHAPEIHRWRVLAHQAVDPTILSSVGPNLLASVTAEIDRQSKYFPTRDHTPEFARLLIVLLAIKPSSFLERDGQLLLERVEANSWDSTKGVGIFRFLRDVRALLTVWAPENPTAEDLRQRLGKSLRGDPGAPMNEINPPYQQWGSPGWG